MVGEYKMNKKILILCCLVLFFMSIVSVSAGDNDTFTSLQTEINQPGNTIELTHNYVYDNSTDGEFQTGIGITKDNFTINGNGFTIDGANQARIFHITGENVTISNLNIINGYRFNKAGAGILAEDSIILNNVTFINNHGNEGGAIYGLASVNLTNVHFTQNTADNGGAIYSEGELNIENCTFNNNAAIWGGNIYSINETFINNALFINSTSKYAPAIFAKKNIIINNTNFRNLFANETAGAIGIKDFNITVIENCTFINTSAKKNGGAIFLDMGNAESFGYPALTIILKSTFKDSSADFGGALVQLGGFLFIENSEFADNSASFDGGAIFLSNSRFNISNSIFSGNQIRNEDYGNGGGIYTDYSVTNIVNCEFTNNTKQGIYAYDMQLSVDNTTFSNNGEAIHGVFLEYNLTNITIGNDSLFLNDTDYSSIIKEIGAKLNLINNTINVVTLPSRYDSRDWGWVSSVKNQGDMGSCWTFGTCGALESALLKATGIEYDFSENNMQNSMLQYSKYGIIGADEGGAREQGLEYILSWFGVFPTEYDSYDELGKLSPLISSDENIHILDAIIVNPRKNFTDNDAAKIAILRCGSITTGYFSNSTLYSNYNTAYYQIASNKTNHAISFVGWDDNYPASNFAITPPGNGAWIVKNSWGDKWGENGFFYLSYYDPSVLFTTFGIGFIIENTENYTTNYQTDLGGVMGSVDSNGSIVSYKNTYDALQSELISAVGTYFNENENYTFEIYVNDNLVHTQSGISPFNGYHTVKLTSEIPVSTGDVFTVVMNKTFIPTFVESRQHYLENVTFINTGLGWQDLSPQNKTVSLKVYTKDLGIYTQDLVKYYKNDSQFNANVGAANVTVTFEINGRNYTRVSDENGIATMNINLGPGNYTIKTFYDGISVENTITVLSTLIAQDLVKYYKNDSQFFVTLLDGQGNPVANTNVTMNINGVLYYRQTNENGTARLNINLSPDEYILTVTDPFNELMRSYNVTVLSTLIGNDLVKYYKNDSQFFVTLLDGQGNPVANTNITMNINGVFYTRTTNENGTARLNINLSPGEYILTATDPLNGLMRSFNITVLSTLTAQDMTMTYLDGSSFHVKAVDNKGNPVFNAKIQFNVNGNIYYRTTNSSGIASLDNINFMPGVYIITSEYNGISISNTITIVAKGD